MKIFVLKRSIYFYFMCECFQFPALRRGEQAANVNSHPEKPPAAAPSCLMDLIPQTVSQSRSPSRKFISSAMCFQPQGKVINTFIYLVNKYFTMRMTCSILYYLVCPAPPGLEPRALSLESNQILYHLRLWGFLGERQSWGLLTSQYNLPGKLQANTVSKNNTESGLMTARAFSPRRRASTPFRLGWYVPLVPGGRCLSLRPGWSTEFQDSHSYTEKLCLENQNQSKIK